MHGDSGVRGNTVLALGLLEEPSAAKILRILLRDNDPGVRMQAAEALWRMKDQQGLTSLVALSLSAYADEQMIGLMGLAQPRDQRVRQHVRAGLTADYPEVRLVAARAMGMLDSDEGYVIAIEGARSADARQRQLAALALGAIGRTDAQDSLQRLLKDEDQGVRLAAASAIMDLAPPEK